MTKVPYVDLVAQNHPFRERILEAVGRVIDHGMYINGPEVKQLEEKLASFVGSPHVIGCSSGTSALTLALRAHEIGLGDEVITVSHSFVATATSIKLVGADPIFVDIDLATGLIDPSQVVAKITPRTRAVLCVHLGGIPCPMDALSEICEVHGLVLLEDSAQAIGARYRGKHVGTFGTGCFSMHPLKTFSALGDAGFITTQDPEVAERLLKLRNIGLRDRDNLQYTGENARLDTLHAAILLAKFEKLPSWIAKRNAHAAAYADSLADCVTLLELPEHAEPAYSCFAVRHVRRDAMIARLREAGVDVKVHYPVPIHKQAPLAGSDTVSLPATERLVGEIMSLPIIPELAQQQVRKVIDLVREASKAAA